MNVRTGYKEGFVSVSGRLNPETPFLQMRQLTTLEFIMLCRDRTRWSINNNGRIPS